MTTVTSRLISGFGANAFAQVVNIIIQLFSVPLFLHFWGIELYGEWLILFAIPAYLAMSGFGLGSTAGSEMSIRVAKEDQSGALTVFQSSWVFISVVSTIVFSIIVTILNSYSIHSWIGISLLEKNTSLILILLSLQVVFVLQQGLLSSAYRCEGNYAAGVYISASLRLLGFLVLILILFNNGTPSHIAAGYLITEIIGVLVMAAHLRSLSPWIKFGISSVDFIIIKKLASPSMAFMAFTLTNALSLQGFVLLIGSLLGPAHVVVFSTLRTITRIALQAMNMITQASWPELSKALGTRNHELAKRIHQTICQLSLWTSLLIIIVLALLGNNMLQVWTNGLVIMDTTLFYLLLLVMICNSFWLSSSVVIYSTNSHSVMAVYYLINTVFSLLIAYVLLTQIDIYGAALALLIIDLFMIPYVLRTSLKSVDDSFESFLRAIMLPPTKIVLKAFSIITKRG